MQRIYVDTSVIGGCFDTEFQEYSNLLFNEFQSGKKICVYSDLTFKELQNAPQRVQNILPSLADECKELVLLDDEVIKLAYKYMAVNAVPQKYFDDALHIAIATVNRLDVLASWNFKHIVNLDRIRIFNGVNVINGYSLLEIRSPRDIISIV